MYRLKFGAEIWSGTPSHRLAVKTRLKHAGLSRDVSLKQILVGRHSN